MIKIHNTTSIPDKLIHIAVAHGIQEGVNVDTIIVRNKKKGSVCGNWGYYYNRHSKYGRCITLTVPQVLNDFIDRRKYSRITIKVQNRAEFVILVMAHELRHAYQYQIQGITNRDYKSDKRHYENDAENWEYVCLIKWRSIVDNMNNEIQRAATFVK